MASSSPRVLLLGGSGRTGSLFASQLLTNSCPVRALVRDKQEFLFQLPKQMQLDFMSGALPKNAPDPAKARPVAELLSIVETKQQQCITQMSSAQWQDVVTGCDTVASCLGHKLFPPQNLVFGPRYLLRDATRAVVDAYHAINMSRTTTTTGEGKATKKPLRLITLGCESIRNTERLDEQPPIARRAQQLACSLFWAPTRDLNATLSFLQRDPRVKPEFCISSSDSDSSATDYGRSSASNSSSGKDIEWVFVRASALIHRENKPVEYIVSTPKYPNPPGFALRSNISNFMTHLVLDERVFRRWKGSTPVVYAGSAVSSDSQGRSFFYTE